MCEVDYADFDGTCSVWTETPRRARKSHGCAGCGAKIEPGEHYLVHFSLYDGEINESSNLCFICWAVRERFSEAHGGFCFAPSALEEYLVGCVRDDGKAEAREWRDMLAALKRRERRAHSASPRRAHRLG